MLQLKLVLTSLWLLSNVHAQGGLPNQPCLMKTVAPNVEVVSSCNNPEVNGIRQHIKCLDAQGMLLTTIDYWPVDGKNTNNKVRENAMIVLTPNAVAEYTAVVYQCTGRKSFMSDTFYAPPHPAKQIKFDPQPGCETPYFFVVRVSPGTQCKAPGHQKRWNLLPARGEPAHPRESCLMNWDDKIKPAGGCSQMDLEVGPPSTNTPKPVAGAKQHWRCHFDDGSTAGEIDYWPIDGQNKHDRIRENSMVVLTPHMTAKPKLPYFAVVYQCFGAEPRLYSDVYYTPQVDVGQKTGIQAKFHPHPGCDEPYFFVMEVSPGTKCKAKA